MVSTVAKKSMQQTCATLDVIHTQTPHTRAHTHTSMHKHTHNTHTHTMLIIPTEDFALTQCNCTHTVHLLILTKEPVCLTNGRWESCKLCHLLPIPTNSLSLSVSEDQVTQLTHEAPFLSRQFVLQVQLHRAVPAELVMAQLSCNLKVSC